MKTLYTNLDIPFSVGNVRFQALNIIFERFLRTIPNHSHGAGSYEIHYIPSGYGKAQIDGVLYDITPNTLYVTGPHVEHFQIPLQEDPMCEYCVYLKVKSRPSLVSKNNADSVGSCFLQYPFWFGQDSQDIHELLQHLFRELQHQYIGYTEEVGLLLSQLIISMVRNYNDIHHAGSHFARSSLSDSKDIIIEEYFLYEYKNLSLDDLAKRLGLSPRQTERCLKEHYNKTFLQKKTESRMSTATILLSDPARSITSISNDLGYSSIEHFSSAFKRYFGVSPKEYRKGHS